MTATLWSLDQHEGKPFNPTRLAAARERRGLTKQAFAELCAVSRRAVTAWESGDVDHPPVGLISKVLDFPEQFFFADDIPEVPEHWVSFRALSSMTSRQVHRILAVSSLAVEFGHWIDARYGTPAPDLPDLGETPGLVPTLAAEDVRSTWGIHERPVKNMLALLEKRGVRVFSLPMNDREIDAFSFTREGRPFVFINTTKSAERMRFDLAHELGHLVLHPHENKSRSRQLEQEANDFASSFLVPADALYSQIRGTPRLEDVFTLKKYWKVSALAMVERLFQLQLISEWTRRQWLVALSQRGYRTSEPDGMHPEKSMLLEQLFRAAREDGWTLRRIAEELCVYERTLDELVFGLAVAPISGQGQLTPPIKGHLRRVK
ncbi:ImmA/IrrE family metallo-endopeptidase [Micromonospora sp. NPDC023644]|uniref:ImmA/IrrE family metallo-endopeptidase n=1 Tax=Micromonospora sp. NPDC023644 TaxID=3154321 RepID=UPI0033FF20BE